MAVAARERVTDEVCGGRWRRGRRLRVGDKDSLPGCFQAATRSHGPVETAKRRQSDYEEKGRLQAEGAK
jgi:hypothetical protein